MKRAIFTLFVLSLFFWTNHAHAQLVGSEPEIDVAIIPESPIPNEQVSVTLASYITDIDSANISWSVDGKLIKSGRGEKTFEFTVGDVGKLTTVGILVQTKEGNRVERTLRIRPSEVDLISQSESYVPPFYRGKALFSTQNKVTFIAMPHILNSNGTEIPASSLVYKWSKNGSVQDTSSGYGKNTYIFIPTVISRPVEISVEVSSANTSAIARGRISLVPSNPLIKFYELNPLYGIRFQKELSGEVPLKNSKEISIIAVPYFFGTMSPYQKLLYKWSVNGISIDSDYTQNSRVFRQPEGVSGVSRISLSVEHDTKILQYTSKMFDLRYGNNSGQ